jgi:hypothetical protein
MEKNLGIFEKKEAFLEALNKKALLGALNEEAFLGALNKKLSWEL